MVLSNKIQGLNYAALLLGLHKTIYYSLTHAGTKFGHRKS